MKTFKVQTIQTFYHTYTVKAEDEDEARQQIIDMHVDEDEQQWLGEQLISIKEE